MSLPDLHPQMRIEEEPLPFSDRERFATVYEEVLTRVLILDQKGITKRTKRYTALVDSLQNWQLPHDEYVLLRKMCSFFAMKHVIAEWEPQAGVLEAMKGRGNREYTIEMMGPPGSGKTTLAQTVARDVRGNLESERFLPDANPFLGYAYQDGTTMLRAQLSFLFSGLEQSIGGRIHTGKWISDTSTFSNAYVFEKWREKAGILTPREGLLYWQTIHLVSDLIPKPDMLVALVPLSIEALSEGIRARMEGMGDIRSMESVITYEDLRIATECTHDAIATLSTAVPIRTLSIDPVELFTNAGVRSQASLIVQSLLSEVRFGSSQKSGM
jgi:deoxyadenosine/deoxycytidine kinase